MNTLFFIPARGGSKGIPSKNIVDLNGVPLIIYSIKLAQQFVSNNNICLSSDDENIIKVARDYGLGVPFKRPKRISTDSATTLDAIIHALNFYKKKGVIYDNVVLLQPTSPLRLKRDVSNALKLYKDGIDLVMTAFKYKSNPFATFYMKGKNGKVQKLINKKVKGDRRQDVQDVYKLNGAVYVFNVQTIKKKINRRMLISEMLEINSVDVDYPVDLRVCEFYLKEGIVKLDYSLV